MIKKYLGKAFKSLSLAILVACLINTAFPTSTIAQSTYLDRFTGGIVASIGKQPVDAATTGNITLSGYQTVDGISLNADNMRCLVKSQTDQTQNGIYTVKSAAWVRAYDFNGPSGTVNGQLVYVTGGTQVGLWQVNTVNPIQIDQSGGQSTPASNITFAQAQILVPVGTSTTSHTIGTGSMTFTTQAGLSFGIGAFTVIADTSAPSNYVYGQITAYSGTSLTVNVTATGGSGTYATWTLNQSGPVGATGAAGAAGATGATGATGSVVPWAIAGGTANAITATYSPPNGSLTDGLLLSFRATAANSTTTPTFSPDSLTAHTITQAGGSALVAGNIAANKAEYFARYNLASTRWELLNPTPILGTAAALNVGTGNNQIVQLDGSSKLPAVDGSQLTNLPISGEVLLSSQIISSTTPSVSDTTHITGTYSHYIWEISNLTAVSANADAYITVKQGASFVGGTSYNSAGSRTSSGGSPVFAGDATAAQFNVTAGGGAIKDTIPSTVRFEFWNPSIAANLNVVFESEQNAGTTQEYTRCSGAVNTSTATVGIKLTLSTGNISTAVANLYGVP